MNCNLLHFNLQNNPSPYAVISSILIFATGTILSNYQPALAEIVFARIADVKMRDETIYDPGCVVPISVKVVALGSRGDPYFIILSIKQEKSDRWGNLPPQKFSVRKSTDLSGGFINYWIPQNAPADHYDIKISVFDGYEKNDGTVILKKILATKEISDAFEVIHDSKSGCIVFDDRLDSPYSEKTGLHYYEARPDGLYRDGVKVANEQNAVRHSQVELFDGVSIYDFADNQLASRANAASLSIFSYLTSAVLVLGIVVGILIVIRKIGIRKKSQVFLQFDR